MLDTVKRLRERSAREQEDVGLACLLLEAAKEIDELRSLIASAKFLSDCEEEHGEKQPYPKVTRVGDALDIEFDTTELVGLCDRLELAAARKVCERSATARAASRHYVGEAHHEIEFIAARLIFELHRNLWPMLEPEADAGGANEPS
jgi:hypothetical protein